MWFFDGQRDQFRETRRLAGNDKRFVKAWDYLRTKVNCNDQDIANDKGNRYPRIKIDITAILSDKGLNSTR